MKSETRPSETMFGFSTLVLLLGLVYVVVVSHSREDMLFILVISTYFNTVANHLSDREFEDEF